MKRTHKTIVLTIVGMTILTVCIVLGFYSITKRNQLQEESIPTTEVERLMEKDIEGNYPGTPREVLKLYCRITKCMYNDEISEEELKQLSNQLRLLFDDALLENNKQDSFFENLTAEITSYQERKERITSYEVKEGDATEYGTINKEEYATLGVSFFIQQSGKNKSFTKTYEQFLLRQDNEKQWKIIHWKLANEKKEENED